ncbi:MAG TPA: sensor domain-containing diguanylate cyclase [Rhodanobacteraceae bacterium]|nr:sensor domain-containing diguanylate cyclase [Rhodanobacteraceae bacterium]
MIDTQSAATRTDFATASFGSDSVATSLPPFDNFEDAARAVLARLRAETGLALWALTRVQGKDCVLLAVDDDNYGLRPGTHLPWTDSLCARMVRGDGPQAAQDVLSEPHYRTAPMLRHAPIRAYIGVPVQYSNGQLFGTLCGFDPAPRGPELARHLPQVRLHARLLGTLMERELEVAETMRRAERAEMDSLADPLTGTYNRRGWMRLLKTEDARCQRYGQSAGVLMADLDDLKLINDSLGHDAGDALLVRAARALSHAVRDGDAVARIGGDEFAVLVIGVGPEEMEHLRARAETALSAVNVQATLGTALRSSEQSLEQAYRAADLQMLQAKQRKHGRARSDADSSFGSAGQ